MSIKDLATPDHTNDKDDDVNNTPVDAPDVAADASTAPDSTSDTPDAPEDAPEDTKGGSEAAKWRRQLRDTQAELGEVAGQLEAARRQLVEGIAANEGLQVPSGLWASGVDVASLVDETGNVDPTLVRQAVDSATATVGLRRNLKPNPAQAANGSKPDAGHTSTPTWNDVLGQRRR